MWNCYVSRLKCYHTTVVWGKPVWWKNRWKNILEFSWYSKFYCWGPNILLIGLHQWMSNRSLEMMVLLLLVGVLCFKAHQMAIKTLMHKLKTKLLSVMMYKTIWIVIAWMFTYLRNSYVENLMPRVMVLGSGVFGRWLARKARALMNGISVLTKEAPEN